MRTSLASGGLTEYGYSIYGIHSHTCKDRKYHTGCERSVHLSADAKPVYPKLSDYDRNQSVQADERALHPDSAGETFCKYAEQIIELENTMNQAMQGFKNTCILKIGTSTTKAISMVTHLIPLYRKEFPNIDIAMSEETLSQRWQSRQQ